MACRGKRKEAMRSGTVQEGKIIGVQKRREKQKSRRGMRIVTYYKYEVEITYPQTGVTTIITSGEYQQAVHCWISSPNVRVYIDKSGWNHYLSNFDVILDEFDRIIGLDRLLVVHLNDSKNVKGAHKDRHANLGLGEIGFDILNGIAHNERIKDVPKILETPYIDGKAPYKEEIDMLKNQEFRNIE